MPALSSQTYGFVIIITHWQTLPYIHFWREDRSVSWNLVFHSYVTSSPRVPSASWWPELNVDTRPLIVARGSGENIFPKAYYHPSGIHGCWVATGYICIASINFFDPYSKPTLYFYEWGTSGTNRFRILKTCIYSLITVGGDSMLDCDSHGSIRSLKTRLCFYHFAQLPAFVLPGQQDDWVFSWHPNEYLYLSAPISIQNGGQKDPCPGMISLLVQGIWDLGVLDSFWLIASLAMLSWAQADTIDMYCLGECLPKVVNAFHWSHCWMWLMQMMQGWVIPPVSPPQLQVCFTCTFQDGAQSTLITGKCIWCQHMVKLSFNPRLCWFIWSAKEKKANS